MILVVLNHRQPEIHKPSSMKRNHTKTFLKLANTILRGYLICQED